MCARIPLDDVASHRDIPNHFTIENTYKLNMICNVALADSFIKYSKSFPSEWLESTRSKVSRCSKRDKYTQNTSIYTISEWGVPFWLSESSSVNLSEFNVLCKYSKLKEMSNTGIETVSDFPNTSTSLDFTSPSLLSVSKETLTLLRFEFTPSITSSSVIDVQVNKTKDAIMDTYSWPTESDETSYSESYQNYVLVKYPWSGETLLQTGTTAYPSNASSHIKSIYSDFSFHSGINKSTEFCNILNPHNFATVNDKLSQVWDIVMIRNKNKRRLNRLQI